MPRTPVRQPRCVPRKAITRDFYPACHLSNACWWLQLPGGRDLHRPVGTDVVGDDDLAVDAVVTKGTRRLFEALLHGPEQIADLPVPVAESPGAVRIGHPERSHLVEYLAPNSVFNSLGASAIKCWWLPRNPLVC